MEVEEEVEGIRDARRKDDEEDNNNKKQKTKKGKKDKKRKNNRGRPRQEGIPAESESQVNEEIIPDNR